MKDLAANSKRAWARDQSSVSSKTLTLEEKVGQVLMLGFQGRDAADARPVIQDIKAGGVIYFARNVSAPEETAALSSELQEIARASTGIPLFISADQEGGIVARFTKGLPVMPGPMALAACNDLRLTEEVSAAIGLQLRACGVNVNLAPVLDVNDNLENPVIGVRSFGSDSSEVAAQGQAAVRGFLRAGIIPVGKHFPGHGNTSVDSHLALPVLPHSMDRLRDVELRPFRAAIQAGLPAIMTVHILFTAIDPDRPATMSSAALTGLLRHEMGFKGLIMTDCLEMNAVAEDPGTAEAAVMALAAGADLLLISHTRKTQEKTCERIIRAVASEEVPMARLDDAVDRILSLKRSFGLPNPLEPSQAVSSRLQDLCHEAHRRSITVLRRTHSEGPSIDRKSGGGPVLRVAVVQIGGPFAKSRVEMSGGKSSYAVPDSPASVLARYLSSETRGKEGREFQALEETAESLLGGDGPSASQVIMLLEDVWKDERAAALAHRVLSRFPEAVVVAIRDPNDAMRVPEAKSFICTYSPRPEAMAALAETLVGAYVPYGKLPIAMDVPWKDISRKSHQGGGGLLE